LKHCVIPAVAWLAVAFPAVSAGQESMGGAQQPQRMQIENRIETEYTVELTAEPAREYCHANAGFEYWQSNTVAHVEGEITNEDCAASGGDYVVSVVYRDERGERQRRDHIEQWSRLDAQPFAFAHDYEIGENVDLIRVSAKKVDCICAESPDEDTETKGDTDE
jgi:hypothetical protein